MLVPSLKTLRTFLTATLAAATFGSSMAQAAPAAKPQAFWEAPGFGAPRLNVDGKAYEKGFFESGYTDAAHAFDANPEAAKRFSSYLEKARLSQYLLWGTLGASVAFLALDYNQWHLPRKEFEIAYYTLFLGGLASSIHTGVTAAFDLNKALNIYNGFETAAQSEAKSYNLSFTPVVTTSPAARGPGAGLAMTIGF